MKTQGSIFHALQRAAENSRCAAGQQACPSGDWMTDFPTTASSRILRHVAFCERCQQTLRQWRGVAAAQPAAAVTTPDWTPVERALARAARWDKLKAMFSAAAGAFAAPKVQTATAFVRLSAAAVSAEQVLFEVNLSPVSTVAPAGLRTEPPRLVQDSGEVIWRLTGFHSSLEGREALLLAAPKPVILDLPGVGGGQPEALHEIEPRIQRFFEEGVLEPAVSEQLDRASLRLLGTIRAAADGAGLEFRCPAAAAHLLFSPVTWMILIVG